MLSNDERDCFDSVSASAASRVEGSTANAPSASFSAATKFTAAGGCDDAAVLNQLNVLGQQVVEFALRAAMSADSTRDVRRVEQDA